MTAAERRALEELDFRLKVLLPEQYQESYDDVQPTSMGSAGLKYGADGRVAWDEIWQTFCDLAMAGGPPHKGTLLEQGRTTDIAARRDRYEEVAAEICRGVTMATELPAALSPVPGWIRVDCFSETMAEWLLRAIVMENVAVRRDGRAIDLPAAPHFRLEKEIKNVVTVIAKTSHYWMGHVPRDQKRAIADLFASLAERTPIIEPEVSGDGEVPAQQTAVGISMAELIRRDTAMTSTGVRVAGWLGIACRQVRDAVWMMRALVASNVLARREDTTLLLPINPTRDPDGSRTVRILASIHSLAAIG